MKNKKSLISVLLAAVLLCACAAGMLIFGAQAEGSNLELTVAEGESITAALSAVTAGEKEGKDSIVINLEGNSVEKDADTLFSAIDVDLPIIINGGGKTVTANVLNAGPITSVNDITLKNVTLVTNATQLNLGNRKVVLDDASIPVGILLNDSDVTADSSLTVRGGTVIDGNLFLLAGQTKLNQGVTTSLFFEEGKVSGKVFGAVDSAEIGGTLNMQMKYVNASVQDRYYGIGGNATVAAGGTLNFTADGANLSDISDHIIAVYGRDRSDAVSCPVVNGTVNYHIASENTIACGALYAVYENIALNQGALLDIDVIGTVSQNQRYVYLNNSTTEKLRLNGRIDMDLQLNPSSNMLQCFYVVTAAASEKLKAATEENGLDLSIKAELTGTVGNFYGISTPSKSVRIAEMTGNLNTEITNGTFSSVVRPMTYVTKFIGDVDCKLYTTETVDSDTNAKIGNAGRTISIIENQFDAAYECDIYGNSTLTINGGEACSVSLLKVNGGEATGKSVNKIRNTDPNSPFRFAGVRNGSLGTKVENYAEKATFNVFTGAGNYNAGLSSSVASVKNTLVDVTLKADGGLDGCFYGAYGKTKGGTVSGNVINEIKGNCRFEVDFYASAREDNSYYNQGVISGSVTTNIEAGSTFAGKTVLGYKEVDHTTVIEGGTFEDIVTGSGITTKGGTFNGDLSGDFTIEGGIFNVVVKGDWPISGGTFNSAVENNATISGGTFNSTVTGNATISGGLFKGAVSGDRTISGGTFNNTVSGENLTIQNGVFNGNITADNIVLYSGEIANPISATESLTLAGGTITHAFSRGEANSAIVATAVTGDVTLKKRSSQIFYHNCPLLTVPKEDLDRITVLHNVRGYTSIQEDPEGNTCTIMGCLPSIYAQLVLEERTYIRILIPEETVQHIFQNYKGNYTWSGFGKTGEIPFDLAALPTCEWGGVTYRYLEMQGFGADQFDDENYFYTSVTNAVTKISVNSLATAGSEMDNISQEEKELFLALLDYGKAAEGTLQELTTNIDVVDDIPEGLGATPGSGAVQFANKTLLMGDTIGIRLTMNLANTTGKIGSVWYYDTDITNLCVIDETKGTLDLFVNAKNLSSVLKITVKDEAGNTCLVLVDTVKNIAKQLVDSNPVDQAVKMKAEATLALIQAVQNYAS